jgi:hypothetical protein
MPSVTHEAPIELIRQHPDLAVELLRAMSDVDLPSEIAVSLGPTDLWSSSSSRKAETTRPKSSPGRSTSLSSAGISTASARSC